MQPPTYPAHTQRLAAAAARADRSDRAIVPRIAIVAALVAAAAALGYAAFALTLRRGVYADLDNDPGSVSKNDAQTSDTINAIGLWVAGVLVVVALVLLVLAIVSARRDRNLLGIAGVALVVLGAAAATWGCLLVSGVDDVTAAGDAVTGYLIAGPAFAGMAVGLILGAVAVRKSAKQSETTPSARAPFPPAPYEQGQSPYVPQPGDRYAGSQHEGVQDGTSYPYPR